MSGRTADQIVDSFNTAYPVGTPVICYKLIRPLREPQNAQTRSKAWVMGSIPMVMVEGVAGGVALESVEPL